MGLFSVLIKTAIETVKLPVAIVKDVATIGGIATEHDKTYTEEKLDDIKDASEDK